MSNLKSQQRLLSALLQRGYHGRKNSQLLRSLGEALFDADYLVQMMNMTTFSL